MKRSYVLVLKALLFDDDKRPKINKIDDDWSYKSMAYHLNNVYGCTNWDEQVWDPGRVKRAFEKFKSEALLVREGRWVVYREYCIAFAYARRLNDPDWMDIYSRLSKQFKWDGLDDDAIYDCVKKIDHKRSVALYWKGVFGITIPYDVDMELMMRGK